MRGRLGILAAAFLVVSCSGLGQEPSRAPARSGSEAGAENAGSPRASELREGEGDLLVIFRPTVAAHSAAAQIAAENRIEAIATWRMDALGLDCTVFLVGSEIKTGYLERRLAKDARVDSVQRNQVFFLRSASRGRQRSAGEAGGADTFADLQYAPAMLNLGVTRSAATGAGVTVGVIDTGADVTHPDLRGRVAAARSFVGDTEGFTSDRHGTSVLGAIVALEGNGIGIAGVAPGARTEALKACWHLENRDGAVCSSYTLALALDYAAGRDFDVLNLSLGGPHDPLLEKLLDRLVDGGTLVVAASGSLGEAFPGELPKVIRADSCDAEGRRWPPSRSADPRRPEAVTAPGAEIFALAPGGRYDFFSGGSMAAAHVSGVLALLSEQRPRLGWREAKRILDAASRPRIADGPPVLDACRALVETGVEQLICESRSNGERATG